jgi:transcriptional regulator with XRE-family HTH domain
MGNDKGIFAYKLEHLFQTVLKPDGSKYTENDVEIMTTEMGERVTATYVYRLRHGHSKNPSYDKIKILSRFFGVSPSYFFEEDETLTAQVVSRPLQLDLSEIRARVTDVEDEVTKDVLLSILTAIQKTRQGD